MRDVSIDLVREYWDRRPCNLRHSAKPAGSREYFDDVERRKYFVEPHIPGFADFARWKGKKVLEIGCGLGTDTMNFARAGARVTAVDLSGNSLALARQRAQVYGLEDRIDFYQANAEQLSETVPVDAYDLIYSFGVIHHSPHPERVIGELHKYCHAGTTLKAMVYYTYSWKVFWILMTAGRGRFWRLKQFIAEHSEAQFGSPVTYTYSRNGLKQMLSGFTIQDAFVDHIFPYRIRDYVEYRYRRVWYFAWLPRPVFRWLEKRIGWHLCVTATFNRP